MIRSWKFAGLALMAVLGTLALLPGGTVTPVAVHADVANVVADGGGFSSGGTRTITVTAEDDDGSLVINAAGPTTNEQLTVTNCVLVGGIDGGQCPGAAVSGNGTSTVTINTAILDAGDTNQEGLTVTLTLTASCTVDATVTITATQGTADEVTLTCGGGTATTAATTTSTVTATGTPPTATSTATAVAGGITLSATPNALGCSGSSFVTILAKTAGGQPAGGVVLSVTTNIGSVSPTSVTTFASDGGALVVFTAPSNQGGTATITASGGGASGTVQITINCAQATATSVPPTAVPQAPATISPPRTGDGGLAAGSEWRLLAGLGLLAASFAGTASFVWARIRA